MLPPASSGFAPDTASPGRRLYSTSPVVASSSKSGSQVKVRLPELARSMSRCGKAPGSSPTRSDRFISRSRLAVAPMEQSAVLADCPPPTTISPCPRALGEPMKASLTKASVPSTWSARLVGKTAEASDRAPCGSVPPFMTRFTSSPKLFSRMPVTRAPSSADPSAAGDGIVRKAAPVKVYSRSSSQ